MIPSFATALVARGATTGRIAMLGRPMAMNQTCYALVSTLNKPFALHCQLRIGIASVTSVPCSTHGSVFDTITTRTFETTRFVLAPEPVLAEFERLVSPMFKRILVTSEENRTLTITTRDI